MKILKYILGVITLLIIAFFLGPRPTFPEFNGEIQPINISIDQLEDHINEKEEKVKNLKPDNQARIVWADSIRKTPWSIVYLHGFSASPMESDPIHFELAEKYACNLYLARITGHGIDDENSFETISPKDWIESAKEAIAIGNILGDKVMVLSCSTGGTLSAYLTAENPDWVDAQILISPNFRLHDPSSKMMTGPWGLQLARKLIGERRSVPSLQGWEAEGYWTTTYKIEGLVALQDLIDNTMKKEVFEKIKSAYALMYYYKNEEECDKIISVEAIREFDHSTSTPESLRRAYPMATVEAHVLSSRMQSKDLDAVRNALSDYLENILNLTPLNEGVLPD